MAPQRKCTSKSTRFSSSATPLWLVRAFCLPSFACSSISSSERESEQAHHTTTCHIHHSFQYHPSSFQYHQSSFQYHHLHSNTTILIPMPPSSFQYHHPHSNTTIFIPIPPSLFQTIHPHSNTTIFIPIPPSSFQYHYLHSKPSILIPIPPSSFQAIHHYSNAISSFQLRLSYHQSSFQSIRKIQCYKVNHHKINSHVVRSRSSVMSST